MELTNHEKQMLRNAMRECVKHADCEMLENVFRHGEWTWADHILEDDYTPTAREIRNTLYDLGQSSLKSLIEKYENGKWDAQNPYPLTTSSGRLYFTIDWEPDSADGALFIENMVMVCGVQTETARTEITDITRDTYQTITFGEDETEYTEVFDKIGS